MLVWGGHNAARLDFGFKPPLLLCLLELSCTPMLAQQPLVGFLVAAPKLEGVSMSQLELSMDRAMQEKAFGSFPGDRPSVFPSCYRQETIPLIFANI